ncbi:MAG: hypothetical protein K5647_08255 [Clostridiales bacterium]|nr:hypothetical protein [Clostridiales bacterium]
MTVAGLIKKQDFLSAPEKSFPPSGFPKGGDAYDIVIDAFRHPVAHMNSIELYTFAMVIIAVITLVVSIKRK